MEELRALKCSLRHHERRWRKAYEPQALAEYREKLATYKKALLSRKAEYYENRILMATNKEKETFKILKELSQKQVRRLARKFVANSYPFFPIKSKISWLTLKTLPLSNPLTRKWRQRKIAKS